MDPVQASNMKNYVVYSQTLHGSYFLAPLLALTGYLVTTPVPLKSADYNAATNTVTLIPRRRLTYP